MTNPIFIVGLPRSGSTLWLNVFAKSPSVFRIGEILLLSPWRKDFRTFLRNYRKTHPGPIDPTQLVECLFGPGGQPGLASSFWENSIPQLSAPLREELKNRVATRLAKSPFTIGAVFASVIDEISALHGFDRCCVKFPVYVNHVPKLLQWYPECRVIHITRDPRAMAVSRKSDPGGTQLKIKSRPFVAPFLRSLMTAFVVVQYIWTSRLHKRFEELGNYRLFRYEDLLADPERVVRSLCEFTQVDFVQEMLWAEKGQASSVTGKRVSGFNRRAASHWKDRLSSWERLLITAVTRGSMRRFGYDPETHPVYQREGDRTSSEKEQLIHHKD